MWSLYYIAVFYFKKLNILLLNFKNYLKGFYNDLDINVLINDNFNKV